MLEEESSEFIYDTEIEAMLGPPSVAPMTLDTLAPLRQWVAWREEDRDGKPTKVPKNPLTHGNARADKRSTWGTRRQANAAADKLTAGGCKGGAGLQLGVIEGETDRLLGGIDLDSCLDLIGIEPWASEIIERFNSYAETSPSGTGVKVFFAYAASDLPVLQAAMGKTAAGTQRYRLAWSRGSHCEIGLDISNRYYAVTGERWGDAPAEIRPVPLDTLLWLIKESGPAFAQQTAADVSEEAARDESGSGHGWRFLIDMRRLGYERTDAIQQLMEDAGKAGEWARRVDDRQIDRAWKSAKKVIDQEHEVRERAFDEFPGEREAADPTTARLNRRHALVMVRGRTLAVTECDDGAIGLGTANDLHTFYQNDRVPAGNGKTEPASARWLRDPERRTYPNGVAFSPGGTPAGALNLWRGWAVDPKPDASCALFLRHVRDVVCQGDAAHAGYVLGWLAHMVQRPDEKPGVALVLKGAKGAGKDTVAEYVARIIGSRHAPTVAESDHIVGKFNARLEAALMLHVQEGSWAGDRKAEGVLKYLVTSDRIEIERKGIDSINLPSVLRLFISANAEWVVPASPDERRWAVFNVSNARRGDAAYFRALRAEMEGDGPAALLHFLRSYDLSAFNVREAPETEGLRDQKLASLRNIERWWFDTLSRGEIPDGYGSSDKWEEMPIAIECGEMRSCYTSWMKGQRFESDMLDEARFGRRLREILPEIQTKRPRLNGGGRTRQYELPSLGVCRTSFEHWLGSAISWEPNE